jgi:transposase
MLNARGYLSGTGQPFQRGIVQHIRHSHGLRSRYARLRARGMLTRDEIADRLKVSADTVKTWGHACNDKDECLYEPPGPNAPIKMQGRRLSDRRRRNVLPNQTNEVQYEA